MESNFRVHVVEIQNILPLLMSLWKSPDQAKEKLSELQRVISVSSPAALKEIEKYLIATISAILEQCNSNTSDEKHVKRSVTDVLKHFFAKVKVNSLKVFFFAYSFLLGEIYDHHQKNNVALIEEEYKLAIMRCIMSLARALTPEVQEKLYTRESGITLCQFIYVTVEMAKTEQLRSLRLATIECIMVLAKIDDCVDITKKMQNQVADVFLFFAPGIISALSAIATEDEIRGHNIALLAIRAWGRFIALEMQDYSDNSNLAANMLFPEPEPVTSLPQSKWKSKQEVQNYLKTFQRTPKWYKKFDSTLRGYVAGIAKLTRHSHQKVRCELAHSCLLLVECCSTTLPCTVSKVVEILIILSEDEDTEVATTSSLIFTRLANNISSNFFKGMLENLEENFFAAITALPRMFSGFDSQEQLSGLNLLIGYIRLFGKTHLSQLLHSATHLQRLIQTLIHICELETKNINLFEEYMIQDLDIVADYHTPWQNFRYFRDDVIQTKLQIACALLAECNTLDMTSDVLLDIFMNNEETRKEATLILNNVLAGLSGNPCLFENSMHVVKAVVHTYLEPVYWGLSLEVSHNCMMPRVQNNIIQICLQVEGLSKIALATGMQFQQFMLKVLYPILERAGSGHPLIKLAGTAAIANISVACGYANVTHLIKENSDYFSHNILRRIHKIEENESVLNVLATVMKFSDMDVLPTISDIISGVLLRTFDTFFMERNANAYVRLFQMFIKCLIRWLSIEVDIKPIKSKLQREIDHKAFQISNLHLENDKEDIDAGKTAEEMYREDMEKWKQEANEDFGEPSEYNKPDPTRPVMLAVKILQRCLNFLPSKDRARKLLVLEILTDGLEIIRDWEDELLPLVHQIWSPLVERFKEKDDSLIINRSFQLLATLARLSKDFIRSRTTKDVLPKITAILTDLSRSSYLKDRGAAYRYTQAYKMQLNVLMQLGRVVTDLDLADAHIHSTLEAVRPYLSDKQPVPLQEAAMGVFCDVAMFDQTLVRVMLQKMWDQESRNEKSEYTRNIEAVLENIL